MRNHNICLTLFLSMLLSYILISCIGSFHSFSYNGLPKEVNIEASGEEISLYSMYGVGLLNLQDEENHIFSIAFIPDKNGNSEGCIIEADWLTVSTKLFRDTCINIIAEKNSTGEVRQMRLTITDGSATGTIKIRQSK